MWGSRDGAARRVRDELFVLVGGLYREVIHSPRTQLVSWLENRRCELWPVRRVGEVLRLERHSAVPAIDAPLLADDASETIRRIQLQPRLGRVDLQHSTGHRLVQPRRERGIRSAAAVQYEVVIVAAGEAN